MRRYGRDTPQEFTFHYVSIKSGTGVIGQKKPYKFTFHYVSIKSRKGMREKNISDIYIPLCIY